MLLLLPANSVSTGDHEDDAGQVSISEFQDGLINLVRSYAMPHISTTSSPDLERTSVSTEPLIGSREAGPFVVSTQSKLVAFETGTGLSIYNDVLLPAILEAKREVLLVTCFWAQSKTLERLVSTLRKLSANAQDQQQIKVHICFSSRSALQKLFHTSSPDGYIYPTHRWAELGIPSPADLPGLDITIKSLFFRPFSVLHSKFLVIDRQRVYFPSCNVSWEDWFECCVGLEGPIVQGACGFFDQIWRPPESIRDPMLGVEDELVNEDRVRSLTTTLLPHPHDSALTHALWFLQDRTASCRITPLNQTLMRLITNAESEIVMLTPNFTSDTAFWATCFALRMGVNVHLITNRRMMVPEQIVTAGTVTELSVRKLIKVYQAGLTNQSAWHEFRKYTWAMSKERVSTVVRYDSSLPPLGKLRVSYFRTPASSTNRGSNDVEAGVGKARAADKSHVKLTLVRSRNSSTVVLGSGNMDRASWVTSQELGVLIKDTDEAGQSTGIVERFWDKVSKDLEGCLESYFGG